MPAQRGVSWNALDRFVAFLELSLDWVAQFLTRVSSAGLTLSSYVIDTRLLSAKCIPRRGDDHA